MNDARSRPPSIEHRSARRDEGVVHTLTVSNPKRLNVLTSSLMEALRDAVERYARAPDSRVLLVRGAGPAAWIGGIDSSELAALDRDGAVALITRLRDVCATIRKAPVPVIAVIRGYCLGPGLEIAASCDLRVAASDASFGMSEIYAGMPAVTGAALLPRLLGIARARELLLTGRSIDTRTAHRWGLVQAMSPPGPALDGLVQAYVADILLATPRAVALQKQLCRMWEERPLRESLDRGPDVLGKAFESGEPGAYFDGRPTRKRPQE